MSLPYNLDESHVGDKFSCNDPKIEYVLISDVYKSSFLNKLMLGSVKYLEEPALQEMYFYLNGDCVRDTSISLTGMLFELNGKLFSDPDAVRHAHKIRLPCLKHTWIDTGGMMVSYCKDCDTKGNWNRNNFKYE